MLIEIEKLAKDYLPAFIYATKPFVTTKRDGFVEYQDPTTDDRDELFRKYGSWVKKINSDPEYNWTIYNWDLERNGIIVISYRIRHIYYDAIRAIQKDKRNIKGYEQQYQQLLELLDFFCSTPRTNTMVFPTNIGNASLIYVTNETRFRKYEYNY